MFLTEHEISVVCYIDYLRSKLGPGEKIGLVRGVPTIVKKTWLDKAKERLWGQPLKWEGHDACNI